MRVVHIYLIAYFALMIAAFATLWQAGVLQRMPQSLALTAAAVAIVLGVLLALLSRTRTATPHQE
jgi:hypothetical protein